MILIVIRTVKKRQLALLISYNSYLYITIVIRTLRLIIPYRTTLRYHSQLHLSSFWLSARRQEKLPHIISNPLVTRNMRHLFFGEISKIVFILFP